MKKILVCSILAATACLSMVGQANAAPNFTQHHAAQGSHQKASGKIAHKHTQVKKKTAARPHSAKKVATLRANHKYQDKHHHARG